MIIFIAFLIIAGALFHLFKKKDLPKQKKATIHSKKDNESELAVFRIGVSTEGFSLAESRNKKPGRWSVPGETIKIDKFEINGGFVYVGGRLNSTHGYKTEASLIDPTLKINTNSPDYTGEEMGYWPSYDSITPRSRAAYLEWLASDRSDPETYIGYVFLYFYGIERRLLVDDRNRAVPYHERKALVLELERLKNIYGHNRSFNGYVTSFLSYLWVINHKNDSEQPSNNLLVAKRNFTSVFKFLLAKTVQNGKPVNEDLALAWVKSHPDYSLRTPARRCENEFGVLFKLRYKTHFGDGMKIIPNKTRLLIDYHTASASLRGNHQIKLDLPDASVLKVPIRKLMDLAESCTKELESLSRFIGRSGNSRDSIGALALLPNDLVGLISAPRLDRIKTWVNSKESVRDRLISVKSLFDHLGEKPPLKINKKEAEMLSAVAEKAGVGIAPDVRFHQSKPDVDGKIMLFLGGHGEDFSPSNEFRKIGTILRLGSLVAGIDNHIADSEISLLENLVTQNKKLKEVEKRSLSAYMHWRLNTPASTVGLKKRLETFRKSDKVAISHILIGVALADGRIAPTEIVQLEKLYGQLGLDKAMVTSDIHNLSSDRRLRAKQERATTVETSPQAQPAEIPSFSLDLDLLKLYEEETTDVQSVLESIFADDDVFGEPEMETRPEVQMSSGVIAKLDARYQNLYEKLITKEKWPLEEVEKFCREQRLMTEGAVETINDWAFDNVDAPLIDDGNVVYIDLEVAEEITTLQSQSQ
ncbi:MAG: TerB N-terminal domain-containing protein [Bacteroidota bacterium]|nr:TerB N-terminal domain-containing protein [Bacteroidota bacterium]